MIVIVIAKVTLRNGKNDVSGDDTLVILLNSDFGDDNDSNDGVTKTEATQLGQSLRPSQKKKKIKTADIKFLG